MAASIGHLFDHTCLLTQLSNEFTRRASVATTDPPKINVQYFYCSDLPIDDPLSPVPPPSSNPANKSPRVPPRPFSVHDNIALENAWEKLHKPARLKNGTPGSRSDKTDISAKHREHIAQVVRDAHEKQVLGSGRRNSQGFEALETVPENRNDMMYKALGSDTHPAGFGIEHRPPSPDLTLSDDPLHIPFDETMPITSDEIGSDEFESGVVSKKRSWSPFRRRDKLEAPKERDEAVPIEPPSPTKQKTGDVNLSSSLPERNTSGTPFLRIPSRVRRSRSRSPDPPQSAPGLIQADGAQSTGDFHPKRSSPLRPTFRRSSSDQSSEDEEGGSTFDDGSQRHSLHPNQSKSKVPEESHVAVGMLRLHMVHMPALKVSS